MRRYFSLRDRESISIRGLAPIVFLIIPLLLLAGCLTPADPGTPTDAVASADPGTAADAGDPGAGEAEIALDTAAPAEEEREGLWAVEFPPGAEWVNTGGPLTMAALEGRYVLLDFWTYGCINCYHMVPNLNELQRLYQDNLVVVGVHSAKFSQESETENIREAVQRYEIEYPVLNDAEMVLWQAYHVPGWPTILLIGPDGRIIGGHVGEWPLEMMTIAMDRALAGESDAAPPLPEELAAAGRTYLPPSVLRYPEGIFHDAESQLLFIADTGNHRIIAVDPESGTVRAVYGDGTAGIADGTGPGARFRRPRGIARLGDGMYVADTGNHAIRRIDLADDTVTTVARGGLREFNNLRSPWGLAAHGGILYIGNAGEHQVWAYDPASGAVFPYAGSGHEGVRDGDPREAEFAQPSGLHVQGDTLWVADPESSAIRTINLVDGTVTTLIGTGLFDFGDRDGPLEGALLMHAADVSVLEGIPYILDTYNSKVKRVINSVVHTVPVAGLNEPKAFTTEGSRLWIADTNNHRIVYLSAEGGPVTALRLTPGDAGPARTISVRQNLREDNLELTLILPEDFKLNEESPNTVAFRTTGGTEYARRIESTAAGRERVVIPWSELVEAGLVDTHSPRQSVQVSLWLYYCEREEETVCLFDAGTYTLALEQAPTAQGNAEMTHRVGEQGL
ncbi:MAG: hypothetical protein EA427_03065 [Spirochaetaceae bacterium]|nr:MAG: hypothetical protein EA427_03065 [Spirochaetaceae bacterium]